jgi:hypothetical protein
VQLCKVKLKIKWFMLLFSSVGAKKCIFILTIFNLNGVYKMIVFMKSRAVPIYFWKDWLVYSKISASKSTWCRNLTVLTGGAVVPMVSRWQKTNRWETNLKHLQNRNYWYNLFKSETVKLFFVFQLECNNEFSTRKWLSSFIIHYE